MIAHFFLSFSSVTSETVGDCYVAITGCPNSQSDHAIRMLRFARESLIKTSKVIADMASSATSNANAAATRSLQLRIGMHSGPTTAGVLRGDKGRFQLFGDTVNTAARMESNGEPGKIHFSAHTARTLRRQGVGLNTMEPRETDIEVKGKGTMATFFAVLPSTRSTAWSSGRSASSEDHDSVPAVLDESSS